jgi:hypothetical protein
MYTTTTAIFKMMWVSAMAGWLEAEMTGKKGCDASKLCYMTILLGNVFLGYCISFYFPNSSLSPWLCCFP